MNTLEIRDFYKDVLFGVTIGDAVGVPVEFIPRQLLKSTPVTDMIGYGTYKLPPGTFSDDSSLTFCLAEALTINFDLNLIGQLFIKWLYDNYWTATGTVFDVGNSTCKSINNLVKGISPSSSGGVEIDSNGNGSLMRISPLVFYILNLPINERYKIIKQVSSITHGHNISVISCFYYLEFMKQLIQGKDKFEIYKNLQLEISKYVIEMFSNQNDSIIFHDLIEANNKTEFELFDRLLKKNIYELPENEILSGGYVINTLEASIWCLLTTDNYKDTILKAVNLGEDTDTTAAVTGGLAGLLYGYETIPENWMNTIARKEDINDLAKRLKQKFVG
jgi:ADP-ribosylglycohydrolase